MGFTEVLRLPPSVTLGTLDDEKLNLAVGRWEPGDEAAGVTHPTRMSRQQRNREGPPGWGAFL